ncbi:DUF2059 domain-containing protein [Niveibacterium sp. SC-1]|uniref:DUF2059 domain-containing protein n=1 Tax=Niveibacterium sp. SC-1 TaxID=3135646 RepID=UPI00311E2A1D
MKTGRSLCYLSLALLLLFAAEAAGADENSHQRAVDELISAVGVRTQVDAMNLRLRSQLVQSFASSIEHIPELQALPPLRRYAIAQEMALRVSPILDRHLSWQVLREGVLENYRGTFSENEALALSEFYRSPLGMKILAATPELARKLNETTLQHAEEAKPEIDEAVTAYFVELQQQLQSESQAH